MYSTFFTIALFLAPAFAAFAINQPELTQCKPANISWAKTDNPPYNLIVVPAEDPCGATPFYELDTSTTKVSWVANVPAGTKLLLSVIDSGDQEVWSENITVKDSGDKSCLPGFVPSASFAPPVNSGAPSGSSPNTPVVPSGGIVDPIGAANAGSNDFFNDDSAAPSVRQPILVLAAIGAVVAMAL